MKYCSLFLVSAIFALTMCGCGDSDPEPVIPTPPPGGDETPDNIYEWESSRTRLPDYSDMVLFYGGGRQRYIENWDKDRLESYVTYTDENGNETWFFDAFLFLEFADYGDGSAMVTYATGYKDPAGTVLGSATKYDWERLINYYFLRGHNLYALDATVGDACRRIGQPGYKRRVVITVPEPIVHQDWSNSGSPTAYWGRVDGEQLDFAKDEDRVKACKWYIDRVRELFDKAHFENIELAGFYWIAEKSTNSSTILPVISEYLHKFRYTFNWIPFYTADGYSQWSRWGFDRAYLQPNYFFNEDIPVSRLDEACGMARTAGMDMEMEFDDNALASRGRAYRLRNYMDAFRRNSIWEDCRLAYYQHNNTVHTLKNSGNADDLALYREFAAFVTTRPYRKNINP